MVLRAPSVPDVLGASPFPPAVAADDDDGFSWSYAGMAGAGAIALLAGGAAVSRRRRVRLTTARRHTAAAG